MGVVTGVVVGSARERVEREVDSVRLKGSSSGSRGERGGVERE